MKTGLIDTNVSLSRWPFRRMPLDETAALLTKLNELGVTQAWVGSFEALLHRDVAGVNARLAEECRKDARLVPFGCVNPVLADWEEDLRRCHEVHGMLGIRLHPSFHGYGLDDERAAKLLQAAAERGLLVQISVLMEDERTQHPLVRVPAVDCKPLPTLVREIPGLRIQLLNAFRSLRMEEARRLAAAGEVYFEVAMLEGAGGVQRLVTHVPPERVLFGSHAPLFYPEAAVLKLKESELTPAQAAGIASENAARLLAPKPPP